ncbi:MAG: OmpA family protein, partial [Ignavibacteriae bacterium]|nr:OmpA family protein [Ignavibacteriota bacterium]
LQSWKLELLQNKVLIREYKGTDEVPSPLDWEINAEKSVKKLTENPIEYRFSVKDLDNQTQEVSGIIRFSEKKQQRENIQAEQLNEHFSLMCFDYDEVKLTKANSSQITLIRNLIPSDATITIIGSTDAIGKEDYNLELSLRRAKAIAKALKTPKAKIIGAGKDDKTFPNNLPEGRIYSRRVDIKVEKSVK